MEAMASLASGFSLAAVAGLNAYLPLLLLGLITRATNSDLLPSPYDLLNNTWVLAVLVLLLLIEVAADKIPGVDTLNDTVQTVVRPLAGGLLMMTLAAPFPKFPPLLALAVGIAAAGLVHATKAGFRPMRWPIPCRPVRTCILPTSGSCRRSRLGSPKPKKAWTSLKRFRTSSISTWTATCCRPSVASSCRSHSPRPSHR